jgi:hypothetical protein
MDAELLPLLQALLGLNNPAGSGSSSKNPATLVANAVCLLDDAVEVGERGMCENIHIYIIYNMYIYDREGERERESVCV